MQWVLKGLHSCRDLGPNSDEGGATSWLDDICMRATSFEGFADLFDRILSRLAMAGMSLKGPKCELLLARCDILGFVATPDGIMIQRPKIKKILDKGAPTNSSQAQEFLGAVAFLRRMIPRISLLTAPMTAAIKSYEKRKNASKEAHTKRRRRGNESPFTNEEQNWSNDSWNAVLDHLDESAVLAAPEFRDPLAEFVMCTDASDYAVGGVLMQWQHPNHCKNQMGPGPPKGVPMRADKNEDGIRTSWRLKAGWELKIIGYYSKTLNQSQRNYPAFDRESGAILLCCRHWSDLITYHPTTVYTDSSVATSMMTKHAAPPRLQRWGAELATYLPHLKIGYRKGVENGLADLLSRYESLRDYESNVREGNVATLPDDFFDFIGQAPLYHRLRHYQRAADEFPKRNCDYLHNSEYQLYDLQEPRLVQADFWCAGGAEEIPGRGMKDRIAHGMPMGEDDLAAFTEEQTEGIDVIDQLLTVLGDTVYNHELKATPRAHHWMKFMQIFHSTYDRLPTVRLNAPAPLVDSLSHEIERAGGVPITATDARWADVSVSVDLPTVPEATDASEVSLTTIRPEGDSLGSITLQGSSYHVSGNLREDLAPLDPHRGAYAPEMEFRVLIAQAVAELLHHRHGTPLWEKSLVNTLAADYWAAEGLGPPVALNLDPPAQYTLLGEHRLMPVEQEDDEPAPTAAPPGVNLSRATEQNPEFPWEHPPHGLPESTGGNGAEQWDPSKLPTAPITRQEQVRDPDIRLLVDCIQGDRRVSKAKRARVCDKYELKDDALYRRTIMDGEPARTLVVPNHMRAAKLALAHYSLGMNSGHAGGQNLYESLALNYYWPGMERECHVFADACEHCGGTKSRPTIGAPSATAPTPSRPFEVIHVDHKGPLPLSNGYSHVLVVVCALTRFTLYIPVKTTSGRDTLDALISRVFSIFGYPLVIVTDNGSHMANRLMQASENLFGFRRVFVKAHTPQANGMAEAAVKKLKIVFDRHSDEYQGWHFLVPMAQATINQRITSGLGLTPYQALFGRQAISLTAIEQPHLLPVETPEQRDVKQMSDSIIRLQARLQVVSDTIKQSTVDQRPRPNRVVKPGDRIWLNYSDSERARYLRKHGRGKPWKHSFVVSEVKPHAVKLIIPPDGSAPGVIAWQSLRKCSYAAPHFHHEELPVPEVDHLRLPIVDDPDSTPQRVRQPTDYTIWHDDTRYEIERVLSAERIGSGWRLKVKWKDYPDPTPEPLWRILRDCTDQTVLADIEQAQANYDAEHPTARTVLDHEAYEPAAPQPTRVQPTRVRQPVNRTMFAICSLDDMPYTDAEGASASMRALLREARARNSALSLMTPDASAHTHGLPLVCYC